MQRIIGCMLILSATTAGGFLYGAELQTYLEKLLYIRHIFVLIKGEMEYSRAPLGEVFERTAGRLKQPYRQWLLAVEKQIKNREEPEFGKIWNRSVDRYLGGLHIKKVHVSQLKEVGMFLGQLDGESAGRMMQLFLNRLELEIEKHRTGLAAKKRLGNCLGIMGGLFLIVILL